MTKLIWYFFMIFCVAVSLCICHSILVFLMVTHAYVLPILIFCRLSRVFIIVAQEIEIWINHFIIEVIKFGIPYLTTYEAAAKSQILEKKLLRIFGKKQLMNLWTQMMTILFAHRMMEANIKIFSYCNRP